jgi:hypothetical protein
MERTTFTVAIAASALVGLGLAGCITKTPRSPPHDAVWHPCSTPQCDVAVKVESCDAAGIKLDRPFLEIKGRDRKIQWEIVTSGYEFALGDVVIKSYDPKREFTDPAASGNKYSWKYKNAEPEVRHYYEYGIAVRRASDGATCGPLDPWIRN